MLKRKYKVSKTISGSPRIYRKWDEWKVGDIVIGKLEGFHLDQYKKNCPIISVEETMFKGDKTDYTGKHLVLNSCGKLDKAMEKVSEGQLVQVEYQGMSTIEKGPYAGKDSHGMEVSLIELCDEDSDEQSDYDL